VIVPGVTVDLDSRSHRSPKAYKLNNSETTRDKLKVSTDNKYECGHGLSIGTIRISPGVKGDLNQWGLGLPTVYKLNNLT